MAVVKGVGSYSIRIMEAAKGSLSVSLSFSRLATNKSETGNKFSI